MKVIYDPYHDYDGHDEHGRDHDAGDSQYHENDEYMGKECLG